MRRKAAHKAIERAAETARSEIQCGVDWLEAEFAKLCVRYGEQPPRPGVLTTLLFGRLLQELAPIGTYRTVPEIVARLAALAFEEQPFPETICKKAEATADLLDREEVVFMNRRARDMAILGKALLIRQGCPAYREAVLEEVRRGENLSYWLAEWDKPLSTKVTSYIALTAQLAARIGPAEPFSRWALEYFHLSGWSGHYALAGFLLPCRGGGELAQEDRRQEILAGLYDRGYITKAVKERIGASWTVDPAELANHEVLDSLDEVKAGQLPLLVASMNGLNEENFLADVYSLVELDGEEMVFAKAKLEGEPWTTTAKANGLTGTQANTIERRFNRKCEKAKLPALHARIQIGDNHYPAGCLERLGDGHLIWRAPQ